jgi:hypothetical protein
MQTFTKDPDAILDYGFNWTGWLASGETIVSASWTIPTGITKTTDQVTTTHTVVWLSGGTVGKTYAIACKITTSAGRVDERTFRIYVSQR